MNTTPSEARASYSPADDDLTRAFIDGWNARLDHDDFDMALHYWMLAGVTHVGGAALPLPEPASDGGGLDPTEAMVDAAARALYKDFEETTDERVIDVFDGNWSHHDDDAEWHRQDLVREMREWATKALRAALSSPTPPTDLVGVPTEAMLDAGRFAYKNGVGGKRGISRQDVLTIYTAMLAAYQDQTR